MHIEHRHKRYGLPEAPLHRLEAAHGEREREHVYKRMRGGGGADVMQIRLCLFVVYYQYLGYIPPTTIPPPAFFVHIVVLRSTCIAL